MASIFVTVCIGLMTLGIWVGIGFLIYTLIQVRRAAAAVEMAAYELGESLSQIKTAGGRLFDFAATVRSGWMRTVEAAVGAAATFWPRRRHAAVESPSNANEH